ncbi:Kae1-associated serine/threonine protein kinase [Candidatus Woesearchaeota archaeon]|nr:Kae1-associated serine/threonine protein kinase [Candidatus Woesearchaeota archaeon]
MKEIARGAEAIIFKDRNVIKHRIRKGYRIPEIDVPIRKFRTRREAKVIEKLQPLGFVPKIISVDEKEMKLEMEFIDGKKLADNLEELGYEKIMEEAGEKAALVHNQDIIHGDLTTSNMILKDKIYFIDFGLSFFSTKVEDKAVDVHLLKEALNSKHYTICEKCYNAFLNGYKKKSNNYKEIINRLEKVESRGRNKGKH